MSDLPRSPPTHDVAGEIPAHKRRQATIDRLATLTGVWPPRTNLANNDDETLYPTSVPSSVKGQLISYDDFNIAVSGALELEIALKLALRLLGEAQLSSIANDFEYVATYFERNGRLLAPEVYIFNKIFSVLYTVLSPIIPSEDDLNEYLLSAGFSANQTRPFFEPIKDFLRSAYKAQGNEITKRAAGNLAREACKLAFMSASLSKEARQPDERDIRTDSALSSWEITRRAKLPERAEPYAEGKMPGENVLEYYERTWGVPYRDKGLLYRDDIKRLGDKNLLTIIAEHCRNHGLNTEAILPKKVAQRAHDELAEIDPASARAETLRRLIAQRESTAKSRANAPKPNSF